MPHQCGDHHHEVGVTQAILFAFGMALVIIGINGMAGDFLFAATAFVWGLLLTGHQEFVVLQRDSGFICQASGFSQEVEQHSNRKKTRFIFCVDAVN